MRRVHEVGLPIFSVYYYIDTLAVLTETFPLF
jgi:hypothetical protein